MDNSEVNDAIRDGLELLIENDLRRMGSTINRGAEIDSDTRRLCRNSMEIYEQRVTDYNHEKLEEFVLIYNALVGNEYALEIPPVQKRFTDFWNKAK